MLGVQVVITSECQDVRLEGCQNIRVSGSEGDRNFKIQSVRCWVVWLSDCQDVGL